MDYHVNRQGVELGTFSLEELRRRRESGELTGSELVWRKGMAGWQPLDSVLQAGEARRPTPPPIPDQKTLSRRTVLTIVAACGVLFVVSLVVFGFVMASFMKDARFTNLQGSSTEGLEVASKAVDVSTNAKVYADFQKRARDFRLRNWLEGYKERGKRDPAWDADAIEMIDTWIKVNHGGPVRSNAVPLSSLADKLAANPQCDDPLLLTATAENSIEMFERWKRLERALARFPESKHKAYPRLVASVSLANSNSKRTAALDASALRLFEEAFADGSFLPEDEPEIAQIFLDGWAYNFFWRNRAKVYPLVPKKSFEWLSLILEGEFHIMEAWNARGGGYAGTVTEKGWQAFSSHLASAREVFTKAWKLRPDLPEAAARMVYVALGDSGAEEMRVWFDRTVAIQFDHRGAWHNMSWGLRPRWHGSLEAVQAFGVMALNTRRFDTDVPRKFFDAVHALESELELHPGQHIYGRADIWPDLQTMYEGYISNGSQAAYQSYWRSTYAVVAFLAGKYDMARSQLEVLDWRPPPENLRQWNADLSLMPLEVAARTGPAGPRIAEAESSRKRSNIADALRRYKDLSATNLDERTMNFIRHRVASLEMEKRLSNGEWVDFLPTLNDLTWVFARGKHRFLPEGTLEAEAGVDGHMLFSRARIGPDFEVQGEFDVVRSSNKDFQAGLVMGMPDPDDFDWYSFRMKRNGDEGEIVSFARGWTAQQSAKPVKLNDDHNTFRFRFQNGKAAAWLNGKQIFHSAPVPAKISVAEEEYLLGLGAFNDMNETVLRYSKVQARRLPKAQSPPKE